MIKPFTKNIFRNLALFALSAAALSACGGAGTCSTCAPTPTPTPGSLTLSIEAPSQYPAGLPTPIEASLTMTNTSNVNATNLVYTIPAPGAAGNYTGVVITPNAGVGSASGDCTNIAAGASCTFIATIGAYANPGSFTVTASTDATVTGQSVKTTQVSKSLQSSISVTTNIGLVNIPNTNNAYYILPSDQTIQGSATSPTTAYVSVLVKVAGTGLNSLKLVDETGKELSYTSVGNPRYTVNSVNNYKVTIPAGKTLQQIQALSNVCTTLNSGENNNTACSNNAKVNLAAQGSGILAIQPTQFNMSGSYTTQVITLTNIGTGDIGNIVYPNWASLGQGQFAISENSCINAAKLNAGQSCTITINYTANNSSGQITPVFSYDDDNNSGTEPKNTEIAVPYTGTSPTTPFSILTVEPPSISLTGNSPRRVITITNTAGESTTGVTIAGGWTLPTLSAPLQMESTNCYASSGSVGLGAPVPMVTKALAVGASCTYTIRYLSSASAGSASLAFTYNNGIAAGQVTNVAVDWTQISQLNVSSNCGYPYPGQDTIKSCTPITVTAPEPVNQNTVVNLSIPTSEMSANKFYFASSYGGSASSVASCTITSQTSSCITTELLCAGGNASNLSVPVSATSSGYGESTTLVMGSDPKVIFVTNGQFSTNLQAIGGGANGYDGGNNICQAAGAAGSLTGSLGATWKALLATNNATKTCQYYKNSIGQVLSNRAVAGGNYIGTLPINSPTINFTENGNSPGNYPDNIVMVGGANGSGAGPNCQNWTSTSGGLEFGAGFSTDTSSDWYNGAGIGCDYGVNRLYCVQQ